MVFWYSECLCDLRLQLHAVCQKAGRRAGGGRTHTPLLSCVLICTQAAGQQAAGVAAAAASGKKEKPGKKKNRGAERGTAATAGGGTRPRHVLDMSCRCREGAAASSGGR